MPASRYGEATGITQTVRNFGSSVGLAVLGSLLVTQNRTHLEESLTGKGFSTDQAHEVADCVSGGGESACATVAEAAGSKAGELFSTVPHDFALATQTVFYCFAGVMAVAFVVALARMPSGRVEQQVEEPPAT